MVPYLAEAGGQEGIFGLATPEADYGRLVVGSYLDGMTGEEMCPVAQSEN